MCVSACSANYCVARVYSCGAAVGNACCTVAHKVKAAVTSRAGQVVIGAGVAVGLIAYGDRIFVPLIEKIVTVLGVTGQLSDPFAGMGLGMKIFMAPFICVIGPVMEEVGFRWLLQNALTDKFESFYMSYGVTKANANILARVTSVFFTAIIFGLVHFSNALFFWCNPVLFLPQVVFATVLGLVLGVSKELSGGLYVPCGIHIANNTLAWLQYML
jgi:membrane protease YdiL (CAAX protease family)